MRIYEVILTQWEEKVNIVFSSVSKYEAVRYSTDRPETRGVFRGIFAKNPSVTAIRCCSCPIEGRGSSLYDFAHRSAI